MILTFDQIQQQYNSTFKGGVERMPDDWVSYMPADVVALSEQVRANPSAILIGATPAQLAQISGAEGGGGFKTSTVFNLFWKEMGNKSLASYVTATRQLIGEMFQSIGILSRNMPLIGQIFSEAPDKAFSALNVLAAVANSAVFGQALDAIGFIPVVGWIIKIAVDLAKMVTSFVNMALNDRLAMARALAAKQLTIPMSATQFSTDGDENVTRRVLAAFREGKVGTQSLITPPYTGGFIVDGVYDDGAMNQYRDETMSLGWVMRQEVSSGGGYVPGTGNMTGALFMTAGLDSVPGSHKQGYGTTTVRDLGSLYPTATGMLNNWWSLLLQPGPALFTINPRAVTSAWTDYIYEHLVLAIDMLKGWAQVPTGIPFTDNFWCVKGTGPVGVDWNSAGNRFKDGVADCSFWKRGDALTIPPDFGMGSHLMLVAYLYKLFFGLQKISDRDKYYDPAAGVGLPLLNNPKFYDPDPGGASRHGLFAEPDSIDIDQAVPIRALENVHERQIAVLQSIDCMYVDGENPEQYQAFYNNPQLVAQWTESVTAVLNSDDWRGVSWKDVPPSRMRDQLRQRAEGAGFNPESLPDRFRLSVGPSVLGDPEPPPPPPPNDVDPHVFKFESPGPGGKKKKAGGGGIVIVAAAVAAFLAMKK